MITEGVEGQVNLKQLFNKCNKDYFSGSVPPCKLEWSGRIKRAVGRAHVRYKGTAYKNSPMDKYLPELPAQNIEIMMNSLKIQISKSFDMSDDDLTAVMLHEMVHILMFSQKKVGGHHGTSEFDGWIKKLRQMTGIKIPFLESEFTPSPKLQAKEGLVLIVFLRNGEYAYTTYSANFMKNNWLMFAKVIGGHIARTSKYKKAEMFKVSHPAVSSVSPKRSLKSLTMNHISEREVKEIIQKGTLFFQVEHGQGGWINALKGGLPHHGYTGNKFFDTKGEWEQS